MKIRRLTEKEVLQTNGYCKAHFNVLKDGRFIDCFFLKNGNDCEVVICKSGLVYFGRKGKKVYDVIEVISNNKKEGNKLYKKFKLMEITSDKGFVYIKL